MAKISIMKVLKSRKKIRFYTILACCLVFAFGVWQIVVNNPFQTKAAGDTPENPIILSSTSTGIIYESYYCTVATDRRVQLVGNSQQITAGCLTWANTNSTSSLTDKYVQIGNGTTSQTIVMYGDFRPKGLVIKNGVTITHAPLVYRQNQIGTTVDQTTTLGIWEQNDSVVRDFDQITGVVRDIYAVNTVATKKKVSIIASEFVTIEDGAKIDVTGRGYPGGDNSTHKKGYPGNSGVQAATAGGPDGIAQNTTSPNYYGWGGGGLNRTAKGGVARVVYSDGNAMTPDDQSNGSYALAHGAGGGSACFGTTASCSLGKAGGGYVNISTGVFKIYPTAQITANGESAADYTFSIAPGGGAGGTIAIVGTTIKTIPSSTNPSVLGGATNKTNVSGAAENVSHNGMAGTYSGIAGAYIGDNIAAIGGGVGWSDWGTFRDKASGAGGGGGYISISGTYEPICEILASSSVDSIPALCEGKDVVIDGQNQILAGDYMNSSSVAKVYAEKVTVWQNTGTHYVCPPNYTKVIGGVTYSFGLPILNQDAGTCMFFAGGQSPEVLPAISTPHTKGSVCIDTEGIYAQCNSGRTFASLTIRNNGILSHSSVLPAEMVKGPAISLSGIEYGTARRKKVDVETAGDITLSSGGMINVNAKGYPGGDPTNRNDGYGPGYSKANMDSLNSNGTGGGAYIGIGGDSNRPAVSGGGSSYSDGFDFGSGSGYARLKGQSNTVNYNGLAGGGRIRLRSDSGMLAIDSSSKISANGGNGAYIQSGGYQTSPGGGGGGSVDIVVAKINTVNASLNLSVGDGEGGHPGGVGESTADVYSVVTGQVDGTNNILISAAGGNAGVDGGNGGGGRILISKITQNGISIKKSLAPVSRGGVANTSFNAYALQKDDRITVALDLTNLSVGQQVIITDDFLKTNGTNNAACSGNIQDGGSSDFVATSKSDPITWTFTPTSTAHTLSYQCTVQ